MNLQRDCARNAPIPGDVADCGGGLADDAGDLAGYSRRRCWNIRLGLGDGLLDTWYENSCSISGAYWIYLEENDGSLGEYPWTLQINRGATALRSGPGRQILGTWREIQV